MSLHEVSPPPFPSGQHLSTASYTRFLRQCMGASDGVRKALKIQAAFVEPIQIYGPGSVRRSPSASVVSMMVPHGLF